MMDVKLEAVTKKGLAVEVQRIPSEESDLIGLPPDVKSVLRLKFNGWQLRGHIPTPKNDTAVLNKVKKDHAWLAELCISWDGELPYEHEAFVFHTTGPLTIHPAMVEVFSADCEHAVWDNKTAEDALRFYAKHITQTHRNVSPHHGQVLQSLDTFYRFCCKAAQFEVDPSVVEHPDIR